MPSPISCYCKLNDEGIAHAENVSEKIAQVLGAHPSWRKSEAELREVRQEMTFALFAEEDDVAKVAATVETLVDLLQRSFQA